MWSGETAAQEKSPGGDFLTQTSLSRPRLRPSAGESAPISQWCFDCSRCQPGRAVGLTLWPCCVPVRLPTAHPTPSPRDLCPGRTRGPYLAPKEHSLVVFLRADLRQPGAQGWQCRRGPPEGTQIRPGRGEGHAGDPFRWCSGQSRK